MTSKRFIVSLASALGALASCTMTVPDLDRDTDEVVATAAQPLSHSAVAGKKLFSRALPGRRRAGSSCGGMQLERAAAAAAPARRCRRCRA